MAATVFDSQIFRDAFGAAPMRAIFSDTALVARYVEVEVALASVQGALGLIPKAAAATIAAKADAAAMDLAKLKTETDLVGYPIVGIVHQLQKQCGDAGRYLHWGATTQDIMDMRDRAAGPRRPRYRRCGSRDPANSTRQTD